MDKRDTAALLLVGTGRMAHTHAERFAQLDGVHILAAVDTHAGRATDFCQRHDIPHAYQDLEQALGAHVFDAVSVATIDAAHAPVCIRVMQDHLPVLCEKPLADTLGAANAMCRKAASSGVLNMVNLTYRVSGALHQARVLIDNGELGDIRHIEASYRQSWLCSDYWGDWTSDDAWLWRLSTRHGSQGVLGDVGIHILDFLTAGTGLEINGLQCRLQTFNKAQGNRIDEYVLDANDSCVLTLQMSNGALAAVHMSRFYTGYQNELNLTVHGTQGAVRVRYGDAGDRLSVCLGQDTKDQRWIDKDCASQADCFERFVDALHDGTPAAPDFSQAGRLQHYLTRCFESDEQGLWLATDTCQ